MPTSKRLRDLIREIRSARTAAEERAVVNKECASIRDSFRDEDVTYRCRNLAKLLYIHMLGYPAHFGQLECMKLIASPKFTDKRIGYLGAMLLLDERSDVHLLVTNSLKNDLSHSTQYIVSLALCTLGSISSTEMSRDLAGEIEKLIKSSNAYIRKKATLCAFRIIRKVPDLMEMFIPCTRSLLNEKNHGVLLTAVCLITEMCEKSSDTLNHFRKMVPNLVRVLKNLIMAGYSPEHDVNGVSDPFLQVKILRLLRILGRGDAEASESMNDILAQVATNTETSKNVGHAILYEIVLTIMAIESEAGLRVLAVNILGRFLLNTDKNIRYVALNTLQRVVHADYNAVQRHRSTIVDCLQDPDVSIRKRAMELCFILVNAQNVRGMMKEMLTFLEHCDAEFKADCCSNVAICAEKFAPNVRWHMETLLKLLTTAGNSARDDVIISLVQLITENVSLHSLSVHKLYQSLVKDLNQQPLVQAAAWCVGEYGDLLLQTCEDDECYPTVTCTQILDVLQSALLANTTSVVGKEYLICALMKLSARFSATKTNDETENRIQHLINVYSTSTNVELQQRSVEFGSIFRRYGTLRAGLLERMPVMEGRVSSGSALPASVKQPSSSNGIVNLFDSGNTSAAAAGLRSLNMSDDVTSAATNGSVLSKTSNEFNLLNLLDDLNEEVEPTTTTTTTSTFPAIIAYQRNDLKITFNFDKVLDATKEPSVDITLTAVNSGPVVLENFVFLAAVPKSFELRMQTPSGALLGAHSQGVITQRMRVINPTKQTLRMRIRMQFVCNGEATTEQAEVSNFPAQLWQ